MYAEKPWLLPSIVIADTFNYIVLYIVGIPEIFMHLKTWNIKIIGIVRSIVGITFAFAKVGIDNLKSQFSMMILWLFWT